MRFHEVAVTHPHAVKLLQAYFTFREHSFPPGERYQTRFPDCTDFTEPAGVFMIAENDEHSAIGCAGIRALPQRNNALERYEIKHLWVDPGARGNGYATGLMNELERYAQRRGCTEIVLDTHENLTEAAGLYLSLGYRQIPAYNENPNATRWYAKQINSRSR